MLRRLAGGRPARWLWLLGIVACHPSFDLPDGAMVTCVSTADCPSGYTCIQGVGRCVRADQSFEVAKVIAASVAVAPDVRARHTDSIVSFQLDRMVKSAPAVRVLWQGGEADAVLLSLATDGVSYRYTYTVGDTEPEGFVSLAIDTVSDAGVPARFELPQAILLDFTPPSVVPDTLSTTFTLPPGAVVDSVSALGLGGEAHVLFALSELTTGPATLEFEPSETLGQTCQTPIGTLQRCRIPLPSPPSTEGTHTLFAVVSDLAGNTVRLDLGPLALDTVAPAPPDTSTPGRVVYTRVPHGAEDTQGLRQFSISATSGAIEPGTRLVVFDDAEIALASRIGVGEAAGTGEVPAFTLVPADRSQVYVAAVDAAGNVSDAESGTPGVQATLVHDVIWYATLAGKQALDPFSNPHRLRGYGVMPDALLPSTAPELSDEGTLGRSDGVGMQLDGAGSWSLLQPLSSPGHLLVFPYTDTWRGELRAVTASFSGNAALRFTGSAWQPVSVLDLEFDGSPEGASNGVAFDAQRGELVLVGSNSRSGDTWVFADDSWRFVPGSGGPRVDEGTMVYDDNRGQVLLFGGVDAAGATSDTYAWNGTTWTLVTSTGPQPRSGAYAVFDRTLGKVVLFGGTRTLVAPATDCGGGLVTTPGGPCNYTDTWAWNGSAWTRLCDGLTADCGTEPTTRIGAALAYDPVRRRAILFGGGYTVPCGGDAMCPDFYEWDGSAWSRPAPLDPTGDGSAAPRVNLILGWDPLGSHLIVAGGEDEFTDCGGTSCRETWQWTGSDWAMLSDPGHPAPTVRGDSVFAFDGALNELVIQGGINEFADTTWAFDGRSWSSFTAGNPPAGSGFISAGTPSGVFRFGGLQSGSSNSTAELYRRAGTTWALQSATTKPVIRFDGAGTYLADATTPYLLVFGGALLKTASVPTCPEGDPSFCYLSDTWGWGAWGTPTCAGPGVGCWRLFPAAGPSRRYRSSVVAKPDGQAVLFGGLGPAGELGDTWLWNGSTWAAVPVPGPAARHGHVSVHDARRQTVVVASGAAEDGTTCGAKASTGLACPDVWEFDGTAWRERVVVDPENDGGYADSSGRAVYWPGDGGMYVPGGLSGELWRWDGGFARRPGMVAEFDFDSSGAPADAIIDRVELRATARASSEVAGAVSTEVTLLAGEPTGWRAVATAPSGTTGASLLYCASRSDVGAACQVRREGQLLLGRNRRILLAATPAGTNGKGIASLLLDYAEARVQYRLP